MAENKKVASEEKIIEETKKSPKENKNGPSGGPMVRLTATPSAIKNDANIDFSISPTIHFHKY